MKPTFLLNTDLKPISALITKTDETGIALHKSVELVREFETPHGIIPAGAKGFVDYVDPENGTVEILMEGIEPALVHWGNIIILVPFQTDELAECIRFTFHARKSSQQEKLEQLGPRLATG